MRDAGEEAQSAPRALVVLAVVVGAAAVVLLALRPRLWELRRELWVDEAIQSLRTLESRSLAELRDNTSIHLTPWLDYALRRWLWFPLFGHQELGLRLPSLCYAMLTPLVVGAVAYRVLARDGRAPLYPLVGAWLAAMWCAAQATEIHYAAEARLYTFISLASAVWAAAVLLARERRLWLAAASFLFLQTHFFAAPLVGAVYAAEAVAAWRRRGGGEAARLLVTCAAIIVVTVVASWSAFHALFTLPALVAAPPAASLVRRVAQGVGVYRDFLGYLALPVVAPLWPLLALAGSWLGRGRPELRRAAVLVGLLLLVVVPAECVIIRMSSGYGFSQRYFMPFFGVGVILIVVALQTLPLLLERVAWRGAWLAAPLVVAATVPLVVSVVVRPGAWTLPAQDFSVAFGVFEELKDGPPIYLIDHPCWARQIPQLYLDWLGAPRRGTLELRPAGESGTDACDAVALGADSPTGQALAAFLTAHPDGVVVLYQSHARCPARPPRGDLATVRRTEAGESCIWTIRGAADRATVERVAAEEGFPADLPWLRRGAAE